MNDEVQNADYETISRARKSASRRIAPNGRLPSSKPSRVLRCNEKSPWGKTWEVGVHKGTPLSLRMFAGNPRSLKSRSNTVKA